MPRAPGRLPYRQWERLRQRVLDRAGWRCERCGNGPPLEAHHLNGREDNRTEALEVLCTSCHKAEHDRLRDQPKARAWRTFARELR